MSAALFLVPCTSLLLLLPLFSVTSASAAPGSTGDAKAAAVQQAIQAAFDEQDTAIQDHQIDAVMVPYAADALFINDFKGTEDQGLASVRQGWLSLFSLRTQRLTAASQKINGITVSKTDTGATVLARRHLDFSGATRSGQPFKTGVEELLRCFWAKTADGWRIKQERIISVDTFQNGKLIRHDQKPPAA